jgi:tyrosine-protein kinase Etk/Wzc
MFVNACSSSIIWQKLMPTDVPVSDLQEQLSPSTVPAVAAGIGRRKDEISLLDLLIVLAERKHFILGVTAGFAIAATAVSFLLPRRYTATVTLLPPQQNTSLGAQLASQLGSMGGMAMSLAGGTNLIKNPNDMYVAMFKSRTVEDEMVQRFELMREYRTKFQSDARKAFEHHSSVDGSTKDGLIHISVQDRDPRRAAELANGYVDAFRDLSKGLAFTEAQQRSQFFGKQLEDAKDKLAKAEQVLTATEQKTGVLQPDAQAKALIESAVALRAQIAAKEVQIQGMQTYATGENAQLVEAEKELDSLRAQLAKLGGNEGTAESDIIPAKGQMTEAGMQYVRGLRDVKYYETIFDILARQFEMAKLDEAKEGAVIQVIDPAAPPDKRSFPKRGLIVLIATAAGLFLGVLAAFIFEGFRILKRNPETSGKLALLRHTIAH